MVKYGELDTKCSDCPKGPRRCAPCSSRNERRRAAGEISPRGSAWTPEYTREYMRGYYQRNKERQRDKEREKRYGLAPGAYGDMVRQQAGLCPICHRMPEASLVVDHDHKTGLVRDLLCGLCNVGLGAFADNPESLRAAAEYVERHRG